MSTKIADSRGRISLGKEFANQTFLLEKVTETEIRLEIAAVIPARERWLYDNPEARDSVLTGLAQARAGEFSESPPDLEADQSLADGVGSDE